MNQEELEITNYTQLFDQIEKDIKTELPDKSRGLIAEFVGYRHVELKELEKDIKKKELP